MYAAFAGETTNPAHCLPKTCQQDELDRHVGKGNLPRQAYNLIVNAVRRYIAEDL